MWQQAFIIYFVYGWYRYRDPKTGLAYATLDAFKAIRERCYFDTKCCCILHLIKLVLVSYSLLLTRGNMFSLTLSFYLSYVFHTSYVFFWFCEGSWTNTMAWERKWRWEICLRHLLLLTAFLQNEREQWFQRQADHFLLEALLVSVIWRLQKRVKIQSQILIDNDLPWLVGWYIGKAFTFNLHHHELTVIWTISSGCCWWSKMLSEMFWPRSEMNIM